MRVEKIFEAVQLYLIDEPEHFSELPLGKTFFLEPDNIRFRQVDQQAVGVPAKRHAHSGKFHEIFVIGKGFLSHDYPVIPY